MFIPAGTRSIAAAGLALATFVAAAAATAALLSPRVNAQNAASIGSPPGTFFFGLTPQFAVSPDGRQVVFVAHASGQPPSLWVRPVAAGTARMLAASEQASYPFWSPDGRHVGFFSSGKLKTMPIDGGPAVIVCDAPTGRGGTWNASGVIVFASGLTDPLRQVNAAGGTPSPASVVDVAVENSHRWPQFLPDGRHLVFWAGGGKAPPQMKIAALGSATAVSIGPAESNGAYGAGHVFFKRGNALVAQRIDPATFAPVGAAVQVVEPISADAGSFFASVAASSAGVLLYTQGTARPARLTWFDRTARSSGTLGDPGYYTNATMSPDGTRLAVSLTAGSPANRDVWIVNVPAGPTSRLTTDPAVDATPVWSPDGAEVVFSSTRSGGYQMYRRRADGSGTDTLLVKSDRPAIATDWSRDGQIVVYTRTGPASTGLDVWLHLLNSGQSFPIVETPGTDDNGALSPNGRWLAYQSNEGGGTEIYVLPAPTAPPGVAPEPGTRFPLTPALTARQISRAGGTQPRWRANGEELYFLAPDGSLMAVAIPDGDASRPGEPQQILPPSMTLVIRHAYTAALDGQRFLVPVLDQTTPAVISVGTWRGQVLN